MVQQDQPRRKYNSSRRQEQARETRRQILEAARLLFSEYGYAGTTIDAIAHLAGVAPETIFAVFSSKRAILAKLVELAVGGDEQSIPLLQRPEPQRVLQEQDPSVQVHLFAHNIAEILERVAPLIETVRMAAKTEPEMAELLNNILKERMRNLTVFIRHLSAHTPLRAGLDDAAAAETVWAITSPELYRLLTVDRGWSQDRYIYWLGDTLARLLLP